MSWRNSKLENVYSFVIFFSPKNNMGTPKDDQNEKNTLEMGFLEYQKRIIGMSHISHCFYFQISFWQKESQSYDLFGGSVCGRGFELAGEHLIGELHSPLPR